jgi:hypothetical protein
MQYLRTVTANPNTQVKCTWFSASVQEAQKLFPKRFSALASQLKNGIESAQESTVQLNEHLHVSIANYAQWQAQGLPLQALTVQVSQFSDASNILKGHS